MRPTSPRSRRKAPVRQARIFDGRALLSTIAILIAVLAIVISQPGTKTLGIRDFFFFCAIFVFIVCVVYTVIETILRWMIARNFAGSAYRLSISGGIAAMLLGIIAALIAGTNNIQIALISILLILGAGGLIAYVVMTKENQADDIYTLGQRQGKAQEQLVLPSPETFARQTPQPDTETARSIPQETTIRRRLIPSNYQERVPTGQLNIEKSKPAVLPPLFQDDPLHQFPSSKRATIFVQTKNNDSPIYCEDAYAISPQEKRFALCDGTSSSDLPRPWAALLAQQWITQPFNQVTEEVLAGWLAEPRAKWEEWVKQIWLPTISQRNQMLGQQPVGREQANEIITRGAAATFLGIVIDYKKHEWLASALGDTCLFLVRQEAQGPQIIYSLPYQAANQFTDNPPLFSSRKDGSVRRLLEQLRIERAAYQMGDIFVLATDALAAWILSRVEKGASDWQWLLTCQTQQDFAAFVDEQRAHGDLHDDDTTLIVIPTT